MASHYNTTNTGKASMNHISGHPSLLKPYHFLRELDNIPRKKKLFFRPIGGMDRLHYVHYTQLFIWLHLWMQHDGVEDNLQHILQCQKRDIISAELVHCWWRMSAAMWYSDVIHEIQRMLPATLLLTRTNCNNIMDKYSHAQYIVRVS